MTTGIYCKACGYDLRGSLEAGRCPECGRAFAPGDPTTFRARPFAAPWKRAVGRWAKRGAILLLVLAVLLGGMWGWYYWGWRQEQAALAEAGVAGFIGDEPVVLGGGPGRWLHDRRVPGRFVLERVRDVVLPETATDADLLPLRKLPELEKLTVIGPITDAGLAHLRELRRLRLLDLSENSFSDAGLVHLEKLTRLQWLDLTRTKVTPAGAARLQAALPGCTIDGP